MYKSKSFQMDKISILKEYLEGCRYHAMDSHAEINLMFL